MDNIFLYDHSQSSILFRDLQKTKEAKFFADQALTSKLEHDKLRTIPHKMMIDLIRRIA